MVREVLKRDGRVVKFDPSKISDAIMKACADDNGGYYHKDDADIADKIAYEIMEENEKQLSVEEIQDIVEEKLSSNDRFNVAKKYIIYRNDRSKVRQGNSKLMRDVAKKLMASDVQNQNANIDEKSFGGRVGEASDAVMKEYALNYIVSEMSRNNHLNNEIYIHDLGHYAIGNHNCLTIPFDDLLKNGFNVRQTDVRPAQSINTALQLIAVIFQLQSLQQFGGVSAGHLDWTLVPYVKKSFFKHYIVSYLKTRPDFVELDLEDMLFDDYKEHIGNGVYITRNRFEDWVDVNKEKCLEELGLEEKDFCFDNKDKFDQFLYQSALHDTIVETKQAVEGMFHNLNTLQSRSGNQLPFTSINYGTCTSKEGRLIIKSLIKGSIKGVGKFHKTSVFPCGIFQCMSGVNRSPENPNYDLYRLALSSTAQRLYPNYANCDWSGNAGYDRSNPETFFSTMGCRTANGFDINGFGQMKDGRGNICPVTIVMPTLAMEAKEYVMKNSEPFAEELEGQVVDRFMELLDQKIHEAKDMLIERFDYICSQSADSAKFMYENGTVRGYVPEAGIVSALKHGTLAIGSIALAETLQILIGKDHTTEEGMELAKHIYSLFKNRCNEFKEKYNLNFGVYMTPAENLAHTALKKFRDKYGVIPNVSDKEFFTNSIHVPVWVEMNPFEKIDIEAQLTGYSSAGCITYVELDSGVKNNIDALEQIVNYAMDKDIPYFAINVPNDMCNDCGYTDEINDECPMCGCTDIRRLRRVTGYLTGDYKSAFNKGKQQETEMRVKHMRTR